MISEQKKLRIPWDKLAEGLAISGEGLRIAFKRNSVAEEYLNHVERVLGIQQKPTEEIKDKDLRFEDVLAQKIIDSLKPYIEEANDMQAEKEKLLKDVVNLLKAQMVNIAQLQNQVDLLKGKIDHIESVSEQSNQVLLGRN